jgi:YesN/AraC family two-component response regulator
MKTVLQSKKILIVDDEPDLREMLEFEFEMSGADVTTAPNGREAFKLIQNSQFDVVISDIRMPGGDGVELIQSISEANMDLPLVFISGFADIQVDEAYQLGASGYFPKPFILQDIVNKVVSLTESPQSRWSKEVNYEEADIKIERQLESLSDPQFGFGKGGILVSKLGKMPRVDSSVHFKYSFDLEDFQLEGMGLVKWVKKVKGELETCAGLDITNLSEESKKRFLSLVEAKCPKAYIPKVDT